MEANPVAEPQEAKKRGRPRKAAKTERIDFRLALLEHQKSAINEAGLIVQADLRNFYDPKIHLFPLLEDFISRETWLDFRAFQAELEATRLTNDAGELRKEAQKERDLGPPALRALRIKASRAQKTFESASAELNAHLNGGVK